MNKQKIDYERRNFVKQTLASFTGITILPSILRKEVNTNDKQNENKKEFIYRTLGRTGIKLPIISMGVMNADNPNLVRAALDAGIVYLDTANNYQGGRNETMIGEVIKDRSRDSYIIATKLYGEGLDRKTGLWTDRTKAEPFIEKLETSLKRLGLEYVDVLFMHSVVKREAALFEPLLSALVKFKKEGKTRFIGVSTHRNEPEVINAAIDSKEYDVVLTAYNFQQPHVNEVKKAIARASKAGLGVVAMKVMAGGYWDRERKHPINAKAALKWAFQNENVHTAIPGFTTFDQMNLDLSVMEDLTLSPAEKSDLKLGQKPGKTGLYCQQCGKCIPQCREHLEIPTLMRSYMYAYGYRNLALARETFQAADLHHAPCTGCQTCSVQCSMGFQVRDKIMDIARIRQIPMDFLV